MEEKERERKERKRKDVDESKEREWKGRPEQRMGERMEGKECMWMRRSKENGREDKAADSG